MTTIETCPFQAGRRQCFRGVRVGGMVASLAILTWLGCLMPASGQKLRLEIEPEWQGRPLVLNQKLPGGKVGGISISRLDGLLSQLALQRTDGSWLESEQWHVFFSAEKQRLSAVADGLPAQEFKAIRFRVGVDATTDTSDPQVWPAEHSLHPDVCGLHWGWRSGYVFLAIEGHWDKETNVIGGFSYHLAGAQEPMWVELPARFSGARPTTLRLKMVLDPILSGGEVLRESISTHSRSGDLLAPRLKERVARSFAVKSVQTDIYQPVAAVPRHGLWLCRNGCPR
jgi:hypothetical protein